MEKAQSLDQEPQPVEIDLSRDSLSDRIYAHLRLELMTGLHTPGSRISIRGLAASLNTSATPVREAVFQLVREGALELKPGYQPRVPTLEIPVYLNIRETRVPLERLAGELAAVHITPDEIGALRDHHQGFQAGEANEDWRAALSANQAFHFTIYRASKNDTLVRVIENLWLLAGPFVSSQYPHIRQASSEVHPHLLIIDALERRSPSETGDLLVRDLREGSYRILRHLEEKGTEKKKSKRSARKR
ncbi:GntR family transcriptional regulator [Mesorhizobium denitrificans]|uniref:GntR family transcriptional regulator n=1 Tax=Mesorhizobium denitrificans TaxID=2294114 RepID=A0A371XI82_9HYPH|nr:GntR family transcriptional regulator [Mesorhizobium denitrificans]